MKKGFSTLFIVIILGSIALSLTIAISTSSLWSAQGSISTKQSNQAKALVNACAEVALETIRQNNSYTGSNTLVLEGNECQYTVSNGGGSQRIISVTGIVEGVTRKIEITTESFNPLSIGSWQEVS